MYIGGVFVDLKRFEICVVILIQPMEHFQRPISKMQYFTLDANWSVVCFFGPGAVYTRIYFSKP